MLKRSFSAAICLFSFVFVYSCSTTQTSNAVNSSNATTNVAVNKQPQTTGTAVDELAKGRQLYVDNCAKCHKEDGTGGEVVVDGRKMKADNLTDDRRKKLTDDKMFKVMVDGIEDEGMPAFKDKMSEAEMREVVRYIRVDLQKMPRSLIGVNSLAQ